MASAGEAARTPAAGAAEWIRLLRARQWVKNFFVLAALLFSGRAGEPAAVIAAFAAFAAFCLLSSAVYVLNDVADRESDRAHPVKRSRSLASGRIAPAPAVGVGLLLGVAGLGLSIAVGTDVALVGAAYLALNMVYTVRLKRVVILDVFALAAFFVLRLLAGAAAVDVAPSIWLLLCGGLLALYLGFAKRRHELLLMGEGSVAHREVLAHYGPVFLDQMSVVLLSVTIVSYIMYTLVSETAVAVGTDTLVYSTVFVLYGVFRYLYLVHQRDGGSPTETLLTDRALLIDILLWLAYCGWAIYRPF
ncbi:MAG: decaprenyl-phosphate phosphoribosyltransferase [Gemmatimonadota bacterium]